jgi:hypothetical protein
MTHGLDADDLFIHRVQQHCAELRLNFFLIEPLWIEPFRVYFEWGQVRARVLLNMHSEHHLPQEPFHRLVRLAHERGTKVIDPPDVALAAFNKARLHPQLLTAGIPVPQTIIVPAPSSAPAQIPEPDLASLGSPFVIKPSMGYGRKGVIQNATTLKDLDRAHALWPDEHFLLQRRVIPRVRNQEPLYFRVYYVFGSLWLSWWNCYTDRYRTVTPRDIEELGLAPLSEIVCRIARLTGMKFFSSEIAQMETGEFVVIDYVNDQCHMLSQGSHPGIGVPDEIVAGIARRLVEGAKHLIDKTS